MPIFLSLILIALGSFFKSDEPTGREAILKAFGSPIVSLFIGLILAAIMIPRNGRMKKISELVDRSIEKSAVIILITGADGAMGGVIKASGVGNTVADAITGTGIPRLILPFFIAAALTTATGSLTVSMVTSSTIVAPILGPLNLSAELAVALIGAGGFCVLHANSSFFWLLSRLHEVLPNTLYKTFTI